MEELFSISRKKINEVPLTFSRYLFRKIDVQRQLIGIKGARGSGKTTLLLQLLKIISEKSPEDVLYLSLDNLYFSNNSLFDLAGYFYKIGGKYLYLDEVHKYKNWAQEIKNIYDSYSDIHIVFTGSSALEIDKGMYDLSRRALMFTLYGLSFREFLSLKYQIILPVFSLNEVMNNHIAIAKQILDKIKPFKYFYEYLSEGYYPFFVVEKEYYLQQLQQTINMVIETDLPAIYNIEYSSTLKLKKLLYLIGGIVPYIPNIKKLSEQIGTTRDTLLRYLHLLHNAHIVRWLSSNASGINFMNKPEKLYLQNTNIAYSLRRNMNIGNLRETFFLNQLSVNHIVTYPQKGDFMIDEKYLFEIGGKNKSNKQISRIKNAYIAADEIEYGFNNKIPLWIFGFLY